MLMYVWTLPLLPTGKCQTFIKLYGWPVPNDNYLEPLQSTVLTEVENIWFFSPLVRSKWEIPQLSQFVYFWGKCVYFLFLNDKHTFLKSIQTGKAEFSCWDVPQLSQFVYFLRKMCLFLIFEWWNSQSGILFSVHFIIQKLKNEHTFLKKYKTGKAEESLILTEWEERKTKYFQP